MHDTEGRIDDQRRSEPENSSSSGKIHSGTPFEHALGVMNVAIPIWQSRVSPVFDVAGEMLVARIRDGCLEYSGQVPITAQGPQARAEVLQEAEVDVLICGAISWSMERAICAAGIEVISQTCGQVQTVLGAYLDGRLQRGEFLMPGCCRRRRRMRSRGGGRGRRLQD